MAGYPGERRGGMKREEVYRKTKGRAFGTDTKKQQQQEEARDQRIMWVLDSGDGLTYGGAFKLSFLSRNADQIDQGSCRIKAAFLPRRVPAEELYRALGTC